MKKDLFRKCIIPAFASLLFACNPDEEGIKDLEKLEATSSNELAITSEKITFDKFVRAQNGFLYSVTSDLNSGPILVNAFRRTGNNTYETSSLANIFNSGQTGPVGNQVDDILAPHTDFGGWGVGDGGKRTSSFANDTPLGNMLIINRTNQASQAYDYNSGGKILFDFSSLGTVTLKSVTVLDIDSYEAGSKVVLYGANSLVIKEVLMAVSGNNGKQVLDLGNTKGVSRMEIILGPAGISPNGSLSGSGAIDNIEFFRETKEVYGCTLTQGYWKTHAEVGSKKFDATWGDLPGKVFYGSGMTYIDLMNTAPKGGNAYVTLAHQYIAAILNMKKASSPTEVNDVVLKATAYFSAMDKSKYLNTISAPYTTVKREDLVKWASILANYNEGKIGPGHCD